MVLCRVICLLGNRNLTKTTYNGLVNLVKTTNNFQSQQFKNVRFLSVSSSLLSDRLYTDKHEWVLVDGENGTVGISNYAQESLGDIVFAQLPDVGTKLSQKDECGALESVKAASELYSPISGTVIEKNTAAEETPSLINSSCNDKGWLFKLKLSKTDELRELMNEEQYQQYLKTAKH